MAWLMLVCGRTPSGFHHNSCRQHVRKAHLNEYWDQYRLDSHATAKSKRSTRSQHAGDSIVALNRDITSRCVRLIAQNEGTVVLGVLKSVPNSTAESQR